jgi:hypothetical protein
MDYLKSAPKGKRVLGHWIVQIEELPDGTTKARWLTPASCHQFMLDWVRDNIETEYGISANQWLARAAELRHREKVGRLWKLADKHPTERPLIVRAIEAIGNGVEDREAFDYVAKLTRKADVPRALKSGIKLPPVGRTVK